MMRRITNELESFLTDARYALRTFTRERAFALTAILALALGIGSTTAVFSFVDRVLFRDLPYPEGDRLVTAGMLAPIEQREFMLGSDYVIWRTQQSPFAAMTSFDATGVTDCDLTAANPARLRCAYVESSFLPTLGLQPLLGRNFTTEEDRPNGPPAALISYGLWKSRFGSNPNAIGSAIPLDKELTTIVGVLKPGFEFPTLAPVDVLVPNRLDLAAQQRPKTGAVLRVYARMKPGVSTEQARAALTPLFNDSLQFVPPQFRHDVKLSVRSVRDLQTHDVRTASWVLLGAVAAVLLLACANVANLLLARGTARRREIAIRAVLGAGRSRLIRQNLTESIVLGISGGAAGTFVAVWLLKIFVAIAPAGIPRLDQATLDARVLAFTIAASIISAILCGLAPALQTPRAEALTGSRATPASRGFLRQSLAAAQIAISLTLITAASLLLQSFRNIEAVPLGMSPSGILAATISLGDATYPDPLKQQAFFDQLESRLRQIPGIESLAVTDSLPPSGSMHAEPFNALQVEGQPRQTETAGGMAAWRAVSPNYFAALKIPIVQGRPFKEEDRDSKENFIILSQTLAKRLFGEADPLGRSISLDPGTPWYTVIGIAENVKNGGILEPDDPEYYLVRKYAAGPTPAEINPRQFSNKASYLIRSSLASATIASWLRSEVASLDPTLPVTIETMNQRVGKLTAQPRFNASLLSLFAAVSVLLAAIGLYGVVSFLVSQRTQEFGVRIALGATRANITRLVLTRAARWAVAGLILGASGSLGAAIVIRGLLFGISGISVSSLAIPIALLTVIALIAAWIPAHRAATIDPVEALRRD
jgi:putative ABC transport system permease protein